VIELCARILLPLDFRNQQIPLFLQACIALTLVIYCRAPPLDKHLRPTSRSQPRDFSLYLVTPTAPVIYRTITSDLLTWFSEPGDWADLGYRAGSLLALSPLYRLRRPRSSALGRHSRLPDPDSVTYVHSSIPPPSFK
jgi:hypothetical protein